MNGISPDPVLFDQELEDQLMPWQLDLLREILAAPPDEPLQLIRSVPDRRTWRQRFR